MSTASQAARRQRFEALVEPCIPFLVRRARRICGDRHLAEDLTQDTLLRAYRFVDSLRDAEAVKGWLATTLNREYARHLGRQREQALFVDPEAIAADAPEGDDGDRERVRRAVARLPVAYREPLQRVALQEQSIESAARALDLKPVTLRVRLHRARGMLAEALATAAPDA